MSEPNSASSVVPSADRVECEFVAEIGTAIHAGTTAHAERLVASLAAAGARAIKTQIIIADEIVHPAATATIGGAQIKLHQRFKELERKPAFYRQLQRLCEEHEMPFFASVFGAQSAQQALDLGCQRIKIASPEVNHIPLLRIVAQSGLPLVLSSGVSTLGDIETALGILGAARTKLLHCVTAYPANASDYNLRVLDHYATLFSVAVGVSDHTRDPLLLPLVALLHGAVMIEKHTHLGEAGRGSTTPSHLDSEIAITPQQVASLTKALRAVSATTDAIDRKRIVCEQLMRANHLSKTQVAKLIDNIGGDGVAKLTAAEAPLYTTTNRSLHATRAIHCGDRLTHANCALVRGESLGGGLSPILWEQLRGARAQRNIPDGAGITLDMIVEIA